ncbi:MAG: hypothetical protein Ct9H300mP13_1380 [Gammaproteobacteria bacterium]|nr:MAG: hypothetical protein Ct9H300mP13_1380 [Gammaproteobacteria bacterium]
MRFYCSQELRVLRQPVHSILPRQSRETLRHAILDLDGDDIDTIVQVGTNLALAGLVDELEQELDKPVVAINAALYWHALRQNGINETDFRIRSVTE